MFAILPSRKQQWVASFSCLCLDDLHPTRCPQQDRRSSPTIDRKLTIRCTNRKQSSGATHIFLTGHTAVAATDLATARDVRSQSELVHRLHVLHCHDENTLESLPKPSRFVVYPTKSECCDRTYRAISSERYSTHCPLMTSVRRKESKLPVNYVYKTFHKKSTDNGTTDLGFWRKYFCYIEYVLFVEETKNLWV